MTSEEIELARQFRRDMWFEALDDLPRAVRNLVTRAPYNFDVLQVRGIWRDMLRDGYKPRQALRKLHTIVMTPKPMENIR